MATLATAFLIAWGVVAIYVGWLGAQQRALRQRIQELETADHREPIVRRRAA